MFLFSRNGKSYKKLFKMEKKEFTVKQIATFKRIAMNVDAAINKKNRLEAKKAELQAELDDLYEDINLMEAPLVKKTGYGVEDLFVKTVTPTGKLDAKGNMMKVTRYELRYPDTFLPPVDTTQLEGVHSDETVDDSPIEMPETKASEAPYNPIENVM